MRVFIGKNAPMESPRLGVAFLVDNRFGKMAYAASPPPRGFSRLRHEICCFADSPILTEDQKMKKVAVALTLAGVTLFASVPASARIYHHHRHCHSEWRHHHHVRVCR
jgi:hypothetical protein